MEIFVCRDLYRYIKCVYINFYISFNIKQIKSVSKRNIFNLWDVSLQIYFVSFTKIQNLKFYKIPSTSLPRKLSLILWLQQQKITFENYLVVSLEMPTVFSPRPSLTSKVFPGPQEVPLKVWG